MSDEDLQRKQRPQVREEGGDPWKCFDEVIAIPGFEDDEELGFWMGLAYNYYNVGDYSKTLQYLDWSLQKMPALESHIFYHMRVCKRVLSIPLQMDEIEYEVKLERKRALPKLLKWIIPLKFRVRCKWCGRYTGYIHPNVPTFGYAVWANCCEHCERMYPMPSWEWDSPGGRIYSYFRKSFSDDEFYKEFRRDYNPKTPTKHIKE